MVNGEDKKWWEREKLTGLIIEDKVRLYNSPNINDPSKMYLVEGDKVSFKKWQYNESASLLFYNVIYIRSNGQSIIKWINGNAVKRND